VAPVGTRVLAYALDAAVVLVAVGLGYAVAAATGDARALLLPSVLGLAVVAAQWVAESRTGATVGNAVTGIRTVSAETGRPAGLRAIVLRQLVVGLGTLVCLVGQWVVVASGAWDDSPAQRGWQDKAAGTLVLRARALRPTSGTADAWSAAVARTVGPPAPGPAVLVPEPPVATAAEGPRGPLRRDRRAEPAVITGLPATGTSAAPPPPSALIDVPPSVAPAEPVPAPPAPDLLAGPRPDRTGAPQVRPADPVLGGIAHTRLRSEVPAPPVPTALRLWFDTGEELVVTGDGLVGRSPGAEPGVVHLVPIDDADRSISKVHLAFGLEPGGARLWVVDRGSTNGTVLVRPAGASAALPAGTRATVGPGWTVRFGRRSLAVQDA
jgi:uncharacterized RDD family membrane protein YckC